MSLSELLNRYLGDPVSAEWLIIRPVFDEVTEITYAEAQHFKDFLNTKGIQSIDLAKEEAIRENVERVLEENPTISIYHADHGSEEGIWGNDDRPVIDLNNVHLLSGKEIFNNNCSSAKKLGVEAWKQNCKAFFGNTDVFILTTDALEEFKIAVTYGPMLRVNGLSLKECLEKTKAKMKELSDKLLKAGKGLAAACMSWDAEILVCYNAEAPTSTCTLRRLAIRLFGPKIGWKLSLRGVISLCLLLIGWGVTAHDFAHQVIELKGTMFSIEGGYLGLILILIGILLMLSKMVKCFRRGKHHAKLS